MVASVTGLFPSFHSGLRLIDGRELKLFTEILFATKYGLIASTVQTQAGALQLVAALNTIETANSLDAVRLPTALLGLPVGIINQTAVSITVFGVASNPNNAGAGDTIVPHGSVAPAATATGITQATATIALYHCFKPGVWKQLLTG